jgi:phospholipid-binding lipoprotein MlaA
MSNEFRLFGRGLFLAAASLGMFLSMASVHAAVVTGVGLEIKGEKVEDDPLDPKKVDPAENVNRKIYDFNQDVDKVAIKPAAKVYKTLVPEWGRARIGNFLSNLGEPVTFVNSVLQGNVNNSFTSFWRFVINSTLGVGGLFDQASLTGLQHQREDFDQTLGFYGVESGPYVVLPILGSTTVRGIFGLGVDSMTNPFNYAEDGLVVARYGTETVHQRSDVLDLTDEIEQTSFDPYSTIRSAYLQHRKAQINNFREQKAATGNVTGR